MWYNPIMTYVYKIKVCNKCGNEYQPKSSVQKYCNECRVIASREVKKLWQIKNKDKLNTRSKVWYWNNLSKARKSKRRWNNSESGKKYRREYYLIHKETIHGNLKKYKDASNARIRSARNLRKTGIHWVCSNCHDANKKAIVHHIDENPFNEELDNLMLLCRDCHSDMHHDLNLAASLV